LVCRSAMYGSAVAAQSCCCSTSEDQVGRTHTGNSVVSSSVNFSNWLRSAIGSSTAASPAAHTTVLAGYRVMISRMPVVWCVHSAYAAPPLRPIKKRCLSQARCRKAHQRSHTWPLACQQAAAWAPMLGDPLRLCASAAHATAGVQRGVWPMRCMVGTPQPAASACPGSRPGCQPYLRSLQLGTLVCNGPALRCKGKELGDRSNVCQSRLPHELSKDRCRADHDVRIKTDPSKALKHARRGRTCTCICTQDAICYMCQPASSSTPIRDRFLSVQ